MTTTTTGGKFDGISHNEIEDAQPDHLAAGATVLLQAMLLRAGVA